MKPIEERIEACLAFLESIRPGYKYSITIHKPTATMSEVLGWETKVSVVGENYQDKSCPHTFLTVKVKDFEKLPEAIQVESQKLIDAEIEAKQKSVDNLKKDIDALLTKGVSLMELKRTLNESK
jgi:hypothetical protein